MLEPWRSRYLQALGVDVYLPRLILPGAGPSPVCDWDWSAGEPSARRQHPDAATPEREAEPGMVAPAPEVSTATGAHPALPVIEARAARREPAAPPSPRPRETSAVPRFALSLVSSDTGTLVIDDAPAQPGARDAYLRLIGNLLFALNGTAAAAKLDVFIWPMVKNNPQIDQGADAAREALAAYVQKQIDSRALRRVLLLGDNAQHWLPEPARAQLGASCAVSPVSAWSCLSEPSLKRRLWHDLRHFAVSGR